MRFLTILPQIGGCFLATLPLVVLTWLLRRRMGGSLLHRMGVCVFCLLVSMMLSIAKIPDIFHLQFSPAVELLPFSTLTRQPIAYLQALLLFLPFGFSLPLLWTRFSEDDEAGEQVVVAGMMLSIGIEVCQLFGGGSASINDLLMNIVGTAAGYGLFCLFRSLAPRAACALSYRESEREDDFCEAVWFVQLAFCGCCLIAPWLTLPLISALQ